MCIDIKQIWKTNKIKMIKIKNVKKRMCKINEIMYLITIIVNNERPRIIFTSI